MRMSCRWDRRALCWIAGLSLSGVAVTNVAQAVCASTPAAAAGSIGRSAPVSMAGEGGGFRVTSMRWDPVLRQRWALVASCAHPEWPAVELPARMLPLDATSPRRAERDAESFAPLLPVVRAGDIVQLWSQEDNLRIEVAAVAEESGGLGKKVRVRLMRRSNLGQQAEAQLSGVVRGPRDVEMQR
jgi:hypothetical protein